MSERKRDKGIEIRSHHHDTLYKQCLSNKMKPFPPIPPGRSSLL
jgi:hypothetical protein